MHGMLTAAILIVVFGLTAVAALWVAARIHLAGNGHGRGRARRQLRGAQIRDGLAGNGLISGGQSSSRPDGGLVSNGPDDGGQFSSWQDSGGQFSSDQMSSGQVSDGQPAVGQPGADVEPGEES